MAPLRRLPGGPPLGDGNRVQPTIDMLTALAFAPGCRDSFPQGVISTERPLSATDFWDVGNVSTLRRTVTSYSTDGYSTLHTNPINTHGSLPRALIHDNLPVIRTTIGCMTSVSSGSRGSGGSPSRTFRFRHWALWHQPLRAMVPLALGVLIAIGIAFVDGRWRTFLLALGVVLATTWHLWLPVTWEIGPRGLAQRIGFLTRRMRWQQVELVRVGTEGFVVRPSGCSSWVASLRSLYVPYPPDKRELTKSLVIEWTQSVGTGASPMQQ